MVMSVPLAVVSLWRVLAFNGGVPLVGVLVSL